MKKLNKTILFKFNSNKKSYIRNTKKAQRSKRKKKSYNHFSFEAKHSYGKVSF